MDQHPQIVERQAAAFYKREKKGGFGLRRGDPSPFPTAYPTPV